MNVEAVRRDEFDMLLELVVATVVSQEQWTAPPLLEAEPSLDARTLAPPPPPPVDGRAAPPTKTTAQPQPRIDPPPPAAPTNAESHPRTAQPPVLVAAPPPLRSTPGQTGEAPSAQPVQHVPRPAASTAAGAESRADQDRSGDLPTWQLSALATATVPTAVEAGLPFMVGLRAELDVFRLSALVTLDRTATTPFTIDSTQHWTALGGYQLVANKWFRLRALGGVSVQSSATTVVAPTLGVNARLLWHFIGLETAATLTPFGAFQQLDGRAELILRGGIFELHAGYRARLLSTTDAALLTATPTVGPTVALGLTF